MKTTTSRDTLAHQDLYAMASRLGGLDTPETVIITQPYDAAYLADMAAQFGLTVTVEGGVTKVQA